MTQPAGAGVEPDQAAPDEPTNSGVKPRTLANPPPPGTLPDAPTEGGKVMVKSDGTCWWLVEVTCPPNTKCNPPPPYEVKCADNDPTAE